nr:Golgi apparatus protein 1-like [Pocillopora verrucosa]
MAPVRMTVSLGIILLLGCHLAYSLPDTDSPKREQSDKIIDSNNPSVRKEEHDNEVDEQSNQVLKAPEKHTQRSNAPANSDGEVDQRDKSREEKRPDGKIRFSGGSQKIGGDESPCADDISRLCPQIPKGNNFGLLVCLQEKAMEDDLSSDCHHMLWEFKRKFSKDEKFEQTVKTRFCVEDLKKFQDCQKPGEIVACLLENRQNLTVPSCKHMMTKMQAIFFSDFRLISHFLEDCSPDVNKYKCGRIPSEQEDEDIHSQNDVLECLEEHQDDLSQACQKQIYRLAELSSDDYHLDRPLYYACKDDRERFCVDVPSGEGRVYKCLKKHKLEEQMSDECKDKLTERQKLEAKDAKANYPLMKNCLKYYTEFREKYECERGSTKHGAMANILICLEKAIQNDEKVGGKCQAELFDLRQQLMTDYSLNPEIVAKCDMEIRDSCQKEATVKEGKTIDCLMALAEEHEGDDSKIRPQCFAAVEELLEETGAGSDYRIDHTLYQACEPVVQTVCKDKGKKEGDVMVLSCLMENLHTDNMIPECEVQLLHLEFFIARDFKLDPVMQKACQGDVQKVCGADSLEDQDSHPVSLILSCLYRHIVLDTDVKVSLKCAAHVERAMHQRAMDVRLMPEIQRACVVDLGKQCSDQVEKGEEIECLQEKFDNLTATCQKAISDFTEEEGEDYKLDRVLVRACSGMVTKFCEDIVTQGNTEGVLPCLVEHKNDQGMDEKCYTAINHWQLVEMKDFHFSHEFKRACKDDARTHCREAKSKHDLVVCLSKKIRDAVISEEEHVISDTCRKHLKIEKEIESENVEFDPVMMVKCMADIAKLCSKVTFGQAKMLECLKDNREQLSDQCRETVFKREEEEFEDPDLDYKLRKTCRKMIKLFCDDVQPSELFSCLKKHKNEPEMERSCQDVITKRQIRQTKDVRLDPQLGKFCKLDIGKFCKEIPRGEGKIVECLKKRYESLSDECMDYMTRLMREAARDYRLDPKLSKECTADIKKFCNGVPPSNVENCLKEHLGSVGKKECRVEIVRQMREGRTDIQSDPVLYKACAVDVKRHCSDVPFGRGKVMKCLLEAHDSNRARFDRECLAHLTNRMKMWEVAARVAPPETIGDLAVAISASPSKNYFFVIFATCLALIFVGGLVFGRLSKRIKREVKDR